MRTEATLVTVGVRRHSGAALIVCLTLVSAVSLLAMAAIRGLSLDTVMTGNVIAYAHARLATFSGIQSAIGEAAFPAAGELTLEYRFGPDDAFATTVVVRHLGRTPRLSPNPENRTNRLAEHFEILATTHGPRSTRHAQQLYWFILVPEEP